MNPLALVALGLAIIAFGYAINAYYRLGKLEAELKRLKVLGEKFESNE